MKGLLRTVRSLRLFDAKEHGVPLPGVSPNLGKCELPPSELSDCLNGGVNPFVTYLLASTLWNLKAFLGVEIHKLIIIAN